MRMKKSVNNLNQTIRGVDFWLLFTTLIIIFFGVIMVFSASYYYALSKFGNAYHFLIRDVFWAVSGIGIMFLVARVNYNTYKKLAVPILAVVVAMLCLLFVPGLGQTINGATRWLKVGITIMPGEWAKLAAILFTAAFFAAKPRRIKDIRAVAIALGVAVLLFALIWMQPNLSTAATVVLIVAAIMFIAGLNWSWIAILGAGGVVGVAMMIIRQDDYKMARIASFLDPFADVQGDSYQVVQGLLAMGSGGLRGVGFGKSIQKTLYLPEPQNDFILAIIGEELGFIGVLLVMIAFLVLIWRCIRVAIDAPDRFSMLLASGVTAMIAIQVLLNIGIVTSTFPPTGVTLPFISYGGNAMWMFCASMGIMLNISYKSKKQQDQGEVI